MRRWAVSSSERQSKRYYATNSAAWRAIRERVLVEEPLCRCGCGGASTEVDHIDGRCESLHDYRRSNLQGLTEACHSAKTARENGSFGRKPGAATQRGCDADGIPLEESHPWRKE